VPLVWGVDRMMDLNGEVERIGGDVVVDEFPRFLFCGGS
jgi:hypothetical protein